MVARLGIVEVIEISLGVGGLLRLKEMIDALYSFLNYAEEMVVWVGV